jgi:CO/xanthine dehydrogenase Mo-binding subunit
MVYGLGYGFSRPDFASAEVEVAFDGSVTVWNGASELGQGLRTVLCQIAAEELGIPYESVKIVSSDTEKTPDSGPVSASRATYVQGNAVVNACQDLKGQLCELAAELLSTVAEEIEFRDSGAYVRDDPSKWILFTKLAGEAHAKGKRFRGHGWHNITTSDVDPETSQGDAYATYAWASQLAEVEVDTVTGQVTVLRLASATDAGKAINPMGVEGQIEGGAVQGLGFALMENMIVDQGEFKNSRFSTYLIPTAADVPRIDSLIVEVHDPTGPHGAKGVAEPATIPTTPAILNAIADAIGKWIVETPASPEKVLQTLGLIPRMEKEFSVQDIPYPED